MNNVNLLKKLCLLNSFLYITCCTIFAQQYQSFNSAEIVHELKKLQVAGTVLYIAAHPDDENTRLLSYLANEKKYRTGYLSLTRGDGGQNLIGDEQGIDLGLIRTQELLAARRIDGAEQFFTSAYDFGFSKTSEETFSIWNKQKILADVVWVIRKFQPDIIIARFPEDSRAGHGHHAASGILSREAFFAAADKNMFPEQLKFGVKEWKAKRVLWNTFNFGNTNTITDNQLKIDVGQYNPLLGKSYGELAAQSRSQHKSQGFGVPSQRGSQYEYFVHIAGDTALSDIMDGVNTDLNRYEANRKLINPTASTTEISELLNKIIEHYHYTNGLSLTNLIQLFQKIKNNELITNKGYYLEKLQNILLSHIGFYAEATTSQPYAYQGDSLRINFSINARLADSVLLKNIFYKNRKFDISSVLQKNQNFIRSKTILLNKNEKLTQPYWLVHPMEKGSFSIKEQQKIGQADVDYEMIQIALEVQGELIIFERPIQYKFTDPVKGELFHPLYIVPAVDIVLAPNVILKTPTLKNHFKVQVNPKISLPQKKYEIIGDPRIGDTIYRDYVLMDSLPKNKQKSLVIKQHSFEKPAYGKDLLYSFNNKELALNANKTLTTIEYDHIPRICYSKESNVKLLYAKILTNKKLIGYIKGAGDKVPEALIQLGYKVEYLTKESILKNDLNKFFAIVTGIRAYNTNQWMNDVYDQLEAYMKKGGNLIVQYNTSNQIGPVKAKIAPFPFTISRNRITDENAKVNFLNPKEVVLNKPNKIKDTDFTGWIQERSVYEATDIDTAFRKVFEMNDPNEKTQQGSLIIAPIGKGNFVYCSLALFRQLPAGVIGAYKLLANLVEIPKNK